MAVSDRLVRWPLVGRRTELEMFASMLSSRSLHGFVLSGPAGVGKSRLAEACLKVAVRQGRRVAQATASAAAATVPLGAVAHLIPPGVDLSDPLRGFPALTEALAGQDRRQRVLMVDDVHLLDTTSAVLLHRLMDAGAVRLLMTVRSTERTSEAVRALVEYVTVRHVEMGVFDLAQTDAVLQAALGAPVGRRTLTALFTASGGNALYLRELVLGAVESGVLRREGEVWELPPGHVVPATRKLTEVVQSRLAHVGPQERSLVESLAVCGEMSTTVLAGLYERGVLERLEQAGVVEAVRDGQRTGMRLAHPLYGEVIRAELSTLRRWALLREEAERIESYGARRRDDALHIASRRLAATGTADPDLLLRAAALARQSHDYPQVLTLLGALPEERQDTGTRLLVGDALCQMGRWAEAEALLVAAQEQAGDEERLVVVLARTLNLMWTGEALAVNERAKEDVSGPGVERILRFNEAFLLASHGEHVRSLALLEDLEEDLEKIADVGAWLRGAVAKPISLALLGRTEEATRWAELAYRVHQATDEQALVPSPAVQRIPLALSLSESGLFARADEVGMDTYHQLSIHGSMIRSWLIVYLARNQWLAGHPASARRWYAEAIALARDIDQTVILRHALNGLAACAALQGDLSAAHSALDELATLPELPGPLSEGELRLGPAWLATAQGNLSKARRLLAEGAEVARAHHHVTAEAMLLTDIARLCGAGQVTARLAELARGDADGALPAARLRLAKALAANEHAPLLASAKEFEALGSDLIAAETYASAAILLRHQGDARAAREATRKATFLIRSCEGSRTPLLAVGSASDPLTNREREIALAAAASRTSKDIAEELALSTHTVNNHLQRIYAKLGVTTRGGLAEIFGMAR